MAVEIARHNRIRVEDLDLIGAPEKFVEIIDGELIQMTPACYGHGMVGFRIAMEFNNHCKSRPNLKFCADNIGFLVKRNPDTLLSPDAALFRARPMEKTTWLEFAPEIAVEVLSPSNSVAEMTFKRHRYFESGTEQFWLVDPEAHQLEIHHRDGRIVRADGAAIVEGEGIAEGLRIELTEIFAGY